MTLEKFGQLFNRALRHSFHKRSYLILCSLLACTSLLFLFFKGIASFQEPWLSSSLLFIPLFLGMGVLLAGQVLLSKMYLARIQGENLPLRRLLFESSDQMLKVSYLTIPLLLLYLLLWVLSSLFLLLHTIPFVGPFLTIVLSFAPFLLNLLSLGLGLCTLLLSFFVCPQIVVDEKFERRALFRRITENPFLNLLFFLIPALAVFVVYQFLFAAVDLTLEMLKEEGTLGRILQSFFIMLPFVALLTPIVNFFINFAAEATIFTRAQPEINR